MGDRTSLPLAPGVTAGTIARDLWMLPENERGAFARAIAARVREWQSVDAFRQPAVWPMVVVVQQDPAVLPTDH